ncbi:MAG: DUF512 domain-containing protein [Ruminiclostridium sp.]|nr:DUF512 domain-containing protein [Ruminiclostridium sp.]
MSVKIMSVIPRSLADKAGIKAGDTLITINDNEINDVLDYQFYVSDLKLVIGLDRRTVKVKKKEYEDLGLEFETYLMDKKQHCRNNCIFCFINQMPKGMRDTLYFKDDDSRLSFLQGNYITMTNLTDNDVERIIKMKLPMNISVHTTNPELRAQMTCNPNAGKCLQYLYKMAGAGIELNTQIVLVPDFNDGKELERTLNDLCNLFPAVKSIAIVPVGLTKFRDNLPELKSFDKESATKALKTIELFGDMMYEKYHARVVYPSDEFFLLAEKPMPDYDYYEDFDQFENGVGMCASLQKEFIDALADKREYSETDSDKRRLSIATGVLAAPLLKSLVGMMENDFPDTKVNVYTIRNDFFGETVTVAGLITAGDIINQLMPHKDELGDRLLITENMLKSGCDIFLDDKTISDVENTLSVKVISVPTDGYALLDAILGE